jgi:hypothetical protein
MVGDELRSSETPDGVCMFVERGGRSDTIVHHFGPTAQKVNIDGWL